MRLHSSDAPDQAVIIPWHVICGNEDIGLCNCTGTGSKEAMEDAPFDNLTQLLPPGRAGVYSRRSAVPRSR